MRREWRALAAGLAVLLGLGLYVVLRMRVGTDITHFLPEGASSQPLRLARAIASGELSRTMVLLVDGDAADGEVALAAGRELEDALRAEPRVGPALQFLEGGPQTGIEDALWQIYEPRRFAMLTGDAALVPAMLTPEALHTGVANLKAKLASPMSSMLSRVAPKDPLLALPALFERLMGGRGEGLQVRDGRYLTGDGKAAVLFLATRASSSDGAVQGPLLAGIRDAFEAVRTRHHEPLRLLQSGTNRFAAHSEAQIRADIQRVSTWSMIGLVALFLVLFASLRLPLLVLPVLVAGFLGGTAICLLLFGEVHGLTLAFGSALIGVSVDYAVHFHCHQVFAPHPDGPRHTLRSIWNGLWLGAATTVVGFVALVVSSFPGLRELAVFASAGITMALVATAVFLPGLAARGGRPTRISRWIVARLQAAISPSPTRRWLLLVPTVLVVAAAVVGLPRLQWQDGLAALNRLDPVLEAEDHAVRDRVVHYEQRRLVVAVGTDEEQALQANDGVERALAAAERAGALAGHRGIAAMLPSAATQSAVDAAVRHAPDLWPHLVDALRAEGFKPAAFEPFHEALAAAPPSPLTYADLAATPLVSMVRPFRIALDSGVAFATFVHGVRDEGEVRRALAAVPGASLIDVEGTLSAAYGAYRERMLELCLLGLVAVLLLVALRHRRVVPTAVAFAPAALAAAGTAGLLALCGVELNMLSLVALLMVVSMGVDYGVFLAESMAEEGALAATHLAVFVAGVTTMLGFGLLAISEQPALRSIGLTSGIGVLLCLVLAPTLCAFTARRPR